MANNRAKGDRRGSAAKLDLSDAMHAVFRGKPSESQRDMVLVDLADFSGFYQVLGPGVSPDERAFREGARSVFGRILSHLNMTPDEREALEQATRHETLTTQFEGEY